MKMTTILIRLTASMAKRNLMIKEYGKKSKYMHISTTFQHG